MENPTGTLQEFMHKMYKATFQKKITVKTEQFPTAVTVELFLPNGNKYKATDRSTALANKKVSLIALQYEGLI